MTALIAVFLAATALASAPQARDAGSVVATGTAQLSGTVRSSDASPAPVRRVTMTLTGDRSGVQLTAVTDDNGQFVFTGLPADRYTVSAAKGGYLSWRYGSRRAGGSGTPVVVTEGQRVVIAMTLIKGSVLTGTVRDEFGAPLPDVTVRALRYAVSQSTGERGPQEAGIGSSIAVQNYSADAFPGTALTDDRGTYRIFGLAPGEYVVSASVRPLSSSILASTDIHQVSGADVQRAQQLLRGPTGGATASAQRGAGAADTSRVNYAPVYHPTATSVGDATVITLGQTEERSDIDVVVRLVPTAKITGTASGPDGSPVSGAQVSVMETPTRVLRATRSNADGTFVIAGINPGRYLLWSFNSQGSGTTEVEVAGRDISSSIVLSPGVTISGRVVFDGATAPPVTPVPLMILPRPLDGFRFESLPDGRFVFSGVQPGKYQLRNIGRPPVGWLLRSAMVNGVDAADIAIEVKPNENIAGLVVTMTDRGTELSGRFVDAAGRPAPEYVLVVFSADRRFWVPRTRRTQQVRPDVDGVFIARDLPPGDYFISAVTDLEDGEWNDPAFLAALAANSPIKITLVEGDKKVQDIRVGGG